MKVAKSEQPVSGKQLLSNLEGQVIAFSSWQDQIDALRKKGVSSILVDELEAMGPQSLEQIKALNQLSEPELDRYVMLWQKKHRQARTQAESELIDLRRDTDKQISNLTKDVEVKLDEYRIMGGRIWRRLVKTQLKPQISNLTKDAEVKLDEYRITWEKNMAEIDQNTVEATDKTTTTVLIIINNFCNFCS